MCSRFENLVSPEDLRQRHGVIAPPSYWPAAEFRPDNAILTISGSGATMFRWGLKASWENRLIINARSETVDERDSFRLLLERRCLIPATAWFEWQAVSGAKRKRRFRLHATGREDFCFAGLANEERVVMLTRAPAKEIAHVHDRMPAVLAESDERRWIDPRLRFADVRPLVESAGNGTFEAKPVEPEPPHRPAQPGLFD